ncbi:MAG: metallophosphoesterase [Patescibacteria group bacterium]|nr:metallophosphoesterase [Patescibacteria group bacterium]
MNENLEKERRKIVIFGDIHFGNGNGNDIFSFIKYQEKILNEIIYPYLRENQSSIERLIFLGDIFHKRKTVDINIIKFVWDFFTHLKNFKIDIIIGNHDTYYKNTNEINSPKILLSGFDNITIHEYLPYEIGNILLVPWIADDNFDVCMDAIKNSNAEIVCGHFEINKAKLISDVFCDFGMPPELFEKYKLVLSGHFHHRQAYNNIVYTGCLWELRYEDSENEKGFYTINYDDDVENGFYLEFVPTTRTYKMFNNIVYDEKILMKTKEVGKPALDLLLPMEMKERLENTYVKVIYQNNNNRTLWEKFLKRLADFHPLEIKFQKEEKKENTEEFVDAMHAQNDDILDVFKAVLNEDIADEEKRKRVFSFIVRLNEIANDTENSEAETVAE